MAGWWGIVSGHTIPQETLFSTWKNSTTLAPHALQNMSYEVIFFKILAVGFNGEWYNSVKIQDPYKESRYEGG